MNHLAEAAIAYLAAGNHLLALTGKRPNRKYHETWDWDNSIHGLPETPEQEAALEAVFEDKLTTGLALLIPPHVYVADIDTDAAAALYLEIAKDIPDTRTAKTPNGLHVWFLAPGADGSRWIGGRTLLLKGFGGYVVAPPSEHFDEQGFMDGVYTWLGDWGPIDWLPVPLLDRLRLEGAIDSTVKPKLYDDGGDSMRLERVDGKLLLYRDWNLAGLKRAIIEAEDGNQNNMIAWAAMQARDEGVPYESAMKELLEASIHGGHPRARARATIRGAYKRGARG